MKYLLVVLIAAVTLNCLAMAITVKQDANTLAVPYIDMLLPPLEVVPDNNSQDATAKINATNTTNFSYNKATTKKAFTTVTVKTTTTTTTTQKPISNDDNNIWPQPSLEVLLPPLFEAKIEQEETATTTKATTTPKTTTRSTTKRPTITTAAYTNPRTTATNKPLYTTTTAVAAAATATTTTTARKIIPKVPDLFLEPLQPPLLDTDNTARVNNKNATPTTTQKPITTTKPKLYKQQETKHLLAKTGAGANQFGNKPAFKDNHVAASQTVRQQVAFGSHQPSNKLPEQKFKPSTYVAKEKQTNTNKNVAKQFNNNNFELYFGSTTPRSPKSGLPTITPFPRRLR